MSNFILLGFFIIVSYRIYLTMKFKPQNLNEMFFILYNYKIYKPQQFLFIKYFESILIFSLYFMNIINVYFLLIVLSLAILNISYIDKVLIQKKIDIKNSEEYYSLAKEEFLIKFKNNFEYKELINFYETKFNSSNFLIIYNKEIYVLLIFLLILTNGL